MSGDMALATQDAALSPEIMEQVLVCGDLSRLSTKDKLRWYVARCEALGLDPRTQPFQYLELNGREILYATKSCAEQLRLNRRISVTRMEKRDLGDFFEVDIYVSDNTGRSDVATGIVSLIYPEETYDRRRKIWTPHPRANQRFRGDDMVNARLKAETKAKRRATLSICGLGMLDETEIETIPAGVAFSPVATPAERREAASNGSGHGHGKYAPPEVVEAYRTWVKTALHTVDAKWADLLSGLGVEGVPKEWDHVVNPFQLTNHLLKWCIGNGLLKPLPESVDSQGEVKRDRASTEQAKGLVALAWSRERSTVEAEAASYIQQKWDQKLLLIETATMSQEEPGANG